MDHQTGTKSHESKAIMLEFLMDDEAYKPRLRFVNSYGRLLGFWSNQ